MGWSRLFPKVEKDYTGSKIPFYFLMLKSLEISSPPSGAIGIKTLFPIAAVAFLRSLYRNSKK